MQIDSAGERRIVDVLKQSGDPTQAMVLLLVFDLADDDTGSFVTTDEQLTEIFNRRRDSLALRLLEIAKRVEGVLA